MSVARALTVVVATVTAAACGGGEALHPATLDTRNDACTHCRMTVSNVSTAAQIVAPGEEPRFFDDLGCLANWLSAGHELAAGTRIFVADHRTAAWVAAETAVFTRVSGLETPMGSGIVAHETAASRDQDPAVRGGDPVPAGEVLGNQSGGQT